MAALIGLLATGEVALSAATTRTVLQLRAPSNHRLKILGWAVTFDGTSPTAEPVQVRFLRQTTDGTFTGLTPVKLDDSVGETLQATGHHSATSTEPSSGDVLKAVEVHPQSGYEDTLPYGREFIVGGGDRVGIECTAPAAVNVRAWIAYEE